MLRNIIVIVLFVSCVLNFDLSYADLLSDFDSDEFTYVQIWENGCGTVFQGDESTISIYYKSCEDGIDIIDEIFRLDNGIVIARLSNVGEGFVNQEFKICICADGYKCKKISVYRTRLCGVSLGL